MTRIIKPTYSTSSPGETGTVCLAWAWRLWLALALDAVQCKESLRLLLLSAVPVCYDECGTMSDRIH